MLWNLKCKGREKEALLYAGVSVWEALLHAGVCEKRCFMRVWVCEKRCFMQVCMRALLYAGVSVWEAWFMQAWVCGKHYFMQVWVCGKLCFIKEWVWTPLILLSESSISFSCALVSAYCNNLWEPPESWCWAVISFLEWGPEILSPEVSSDSHQSHLNLEIWAISFSHPGWMLSEVGAKWVSDVLSFSLCLMCKLTNNNLLYFIYL